MFFVAKELSYVAVLITNLSDTANSLLEPIHELTDVEGCFD